jgi:predicted enzyme related to lactoylglutathione lyase
MLSRFFEYHLRTLDVEAARAFYGSILGVEPTYIVRLHEQAIARGARPHWLGCVRVADVEQAAAAFTAHGATALGPIWTNPEGLHAAVMRDPAGAIVALARHLPGYEPEMTSSPEVLFHVLNTPMLERAKAAYADLLGWEFGEPRDLGAHGVFHPFSCAPGGPQQGFFTDISARPEIHPHWLFQFRVLDLDAALERVRAAGGIAATIVTLPDGDRVAVCDDPQGAAFALHALGPQRVERPRG